MLSGLDNPVHLLILCLIILVIFGAKRLPEMGRSLGSGMREFKAGILGQDEKTVGPAEAPLGVTTAAAEAFPRPELAESSASHHMSRR